MQTRLPAHSMIRTSPRSPWLGALPLSALLSVVLVSHLVGCGQPAKRPASLEEAKAIISGDYEGYYNGGVERFVLRTNGAFSQEFKQDGKTIYYNEGRWELIETTNFNGYHIDFSPFTNQVNAILGRGPIDSFSSTWGDYINGERILWFWDEIAYYASGGPGGNEATNRAAATEVESSQQLSK